MRGPLRVALLGVLIAVGAVGTGYWVGRVLHGSYGPTPYAEGTAAGAPGMQDWLDIPAPDVAFLAVTGDSVRLSDYRGQIVLLNFWGSWCPPCLVEIPHLIEVQKVITELGGTIIGPAVDSGGVEDVRRFADQAGINYPVWMSDYPTAVGRFGAAGYPYTVLIDRDGIIRRQYLGPQTARRLLRDVGALVARGTGSVEDQSTATVKPAYISVEGAGSK